jgi:type I restriction enzyme R subunit
MAKQDDDQSEWFTRKRLIDPKLERWGWTVVPFDPASANRRGCYAIAEYPTANGPADYALCVNGTVLGIVEAKKLTLGPQGVLTQPERYARGLPVGLFDFRGLHVPFLYSTNGEVIWFHDIRDPFNRSRKVSAFHTPAALQELLSGDFDNAITSLIANAQWHPRLRPYQIEANQEIEKAIARHKRLMLLAMATGTGKTFTMVNEVYRQIKSGVGRRILFLVDRRALAAQAVRAFASFEAEPGLKFDQIYEVYSQRFHREDFGDDEKFDPKVLPASYLSDPKPGHAFVYVSTIQRMTINLFGRQAAFGFGDEEFDEDAERIDIPIHAFDVVMADECHRGYSASEVSLWRNTIDHFDAIKIGLTATPAAHTKAYFKDVVFRYEYERAVREGHLVDYDAVKIKSSIRMKGIFLREGEQVGIIDTRSGVEKMDALEDEREFPSAETEQGITSPDSNRKIIEELKKYADEHEQRYGRQPKCLIFAAHDLPHISHADQLVEICRDVFGRGDSFVQKITGRVDRPLQRIREFRNRPNPRIVVTVDMLSTGVDIPDLEFIVLLRPIKSRILFEQMLGRGTRKGENIPDKSHFTVFDCFDGTLLNYFRQATAITAVPPDRPSRTIIEVIEDIWANRDRPYNFRCLVKRLQRVDKEMSGEARERFASFIPDGDLARFAKSLPGALEENFTGAMQLLRNKDFQKLLTDYPRKPRVFYVAYGTEDVVESQLLIRDSVGREYRPEDYLTAFARFVKENEPQVEAIAILLARPKDWGTDALNELRQKLSAARERFTAENLEKAHAAHYGKSLVDIISMVKHAAREQEPLLTSAERVERAFNLIGAGHTFTAEQKRWLDRIREHLVANLTIDREDFNVLPIFSRDGGWARANRAFNGELDRVLHRVNEAMAA